MRKLSMNYEENVAQLDRLLGVKENFDILKKVVRVGSDEVTFYYIDGFVKDTVMQKQILYFMSLKGLEVKGPSAAEDFVRRHVAHVEAEAVDSLDTMIGMVLSGVTLMLGSVFGEKAILIDARSYPARGPEEPENDRVMNGARDGFVETIVFNTALIRRRIRDTSLRMSYVSVGRESKTDVVVCYMDGKADADYVAKIEGKLRTLVTDSLTMGHESLAEALIPTRWYNPFPKIRITERPDAAAAQLLEGSIILLVDNSPTALILPTTIFDFLQETNDFYFPPLTGSYLRIIRHLVFWLTLFLTPTWFLMTKNPDFVPLWLRFALPEEAGKIPILAQLLLVEFIIDGLRLASMNTPSMLNNSLSVVGGLILGDFAVGIGWLIPEVIVYMAFVAIANFSQSNYELGYAFKFLRILLLILTALFNVWGFGIGVVLILLLIGTNRTINGKRGYLYPLIPFHGKALLSLFFRLQKPDVEQIPEE